jgi:ribulose-phosphate 3-epimerase
MNRPSCADVVSKTRLPAAMSNPQADIKLAPSILAADLAHLADQVAQAVAAGADRIHVDVMDGHFVPNISFGPVIVRWLKPVCSVPVEVHLMISEPERYLDAFAAAGADTLIVHQEGALHLNRTVQAIHALGKRAGVAINPATPASLLEEILPDLELVLVMTVNPGFGGQTFLSGTLNKIRTVRQMIDLVRDTCELEVDGGIEPHTAPLVVEAGARVLVAGSAVFAVPGGAAAGIRRLKDGLSQPTRLTI